MIPPATINVLDKHNGFTAVTFAPTYERKGDGWRKVWRECNTLWRPGAILARFGNTRATLGRPTGMLSEYDEHSFYQLNNDVTKALYRVKGYRFRIAVWFDNKTGERIA